MGVVSTEPINSLTERTKIFSNAKVSHSLFIKIEVELFSQVLVLLVYLITNFAHIAQRAIIQSTVVKDKLHVFHEVLDALILMFLQLTFDSREIHRILHDGVVVEDAEGKRVNWICEDVGLLVTLQGSQHPCRCFLPLIEDWSTLGNFWNIEQAK